MSNKIKYCKQCALTGNNLHGKYEEKEINFRKGFFPYRGTLGDMKNCPECGEPLEIINMTADDFDTIRDASNYNRQLLEAMIELNKKDIIEYELKMSQFRNQAQQQKTIEEQKVSDSTPKCPHCHSTKIKPISGTERAASVLGLGILSKKLNKSFKCLNCKYTW